MYDLSVLIPARNEMFLAQTVQGILDNIRGNTEVIVVLDGEWADPGVPDDPRVTLVYVGKSIGQRAATNLACRLSSAKYVMKIDAHVAVDEGFDVKLMRVAQDDWTVIPAMYNLHAFDWVCIGKSKRTGVKYLEKGQLPKGCGHRIYQSPTPVNCEKCGGNMERELIWKKRENKRSEFYQFDTTLHFQYHGQRKTHPDAQENEAETMSAQGSCFMLTRAKYWELNISDEKAASKNGWGQQGVEVACKTWLSGGKLMVVKNTWYAHMFRTQGGDFGFPFPMSNSDVEQARQFSRNLWFENAWEKQIYPLSWLIEKFAPLIGGKKDAPYWHDPEGKEMLDRVNKAGLEFWKTHSLQPLVQKYPPEDKLTKGIIFYTDNQLNVRIAHTIQKQLLNVGLPIVSASLKPMNFGKNIRIKAERGYLTMARQILAALEASTADIIFFAEHDVLYHPSHFYFTPEKKDVYYYNTNVWRVRDTDGHALWCDDLRQLSGLVAYRETLLTHFRRRLMLMENEYQKMLIEHHSLEQFNKYVREMGFEPGTHNRAERVDDLKAEDYKSDYPNIDIRHDKNLTPSRWEKKQFRNEKYTKGWKESTIWKIPGWNLPGGEGIPGIASI